MTPKQRQFVAEYLVDLNATRAAIRAGYSARTAASIGQENLTKPEIASAIRSAQEARAERTEITADRVLKELAKIGFSDIRKAVKWGSRFVERPDDQVIEAAEYLEDQPHGGALKRRRAGDDGADALYVTTVEMVDSEELDDSTAAAVAEIAQTKEGVRIKLHDKRAALVDIGRHLGMFTDKLDVNATHSLTDGLATWLNQRP